MTSKALLYFQLLKYYVQYTKNPEKDKSMRQTEDHKLYLTSTWLEVICCQKRQIRRNDKMEKSTVYFTDFRCPVGTSQLDKLKKLCIAAGIKDIDMEGNSSQSKCISAN